LLENGTNIKRDSVKIGLQVRLLCPWASHLTGLPLPLSNGSLTRRSQSSLRYLLVEVPKQINDFQNLSSMVLYLYKPGTILSSTRKSQAGLTNQPPIGESEK